MNRFFLLLYCYLIWISTRTATTVTTAILLPSEINCNGRINTNSRRSRRDTSSDEEVVSPAKILRFRLPKTGMIVPIQVNEEDFKNTPLSRMVEGVLVAQGGSSSSSSSSSSYHRNKNCSMATMMPLA
jgi:hypothetical protein